MFDRFSHFLAYGSTDQETLRELTNDYDGLLVPGTVAAYQAEGTRGFILTLSAATQHPYAIDPRTPLFQYYNPVPKQSHISLSRVLGVAETVAEHGMVPSNFWTNDYCAKVAKAWVDFNSDYTRIAPKQFDKYARRLGKTLPVADSQLPTWVLAPYLMQTEDFDAVTINDCLWTSALEVAGNDSGRLRRVIAATDAEDLQRLALASGQDEVVVWLDNLDELEPSNARRLADYALAIAQLQKGGLKPFALYGGYFAVALSTVGLRGSSHGVGFSEHRDHIELKTSGGAPARFYVERIHRYLSIDLASELWRQDPGLVASYYNTYEDRDPGEYSYHELMKHSVYARSSEIDSVLGAKPGDVSNHLSETFAEYARDFEKITVSRPIERRVEGYLAHLPVWSRALGAL